MIPPILEEIQAYTQAVQEKKVTCDLSGCPLCRMVASFKLHDRRKRTYLVVIDRLVHSVLSLLSRWKCQECGGTFTLYPHFALPQKRYVRGEVFERAQDYLEEDSQSYRKATRVEGLPVFYESADGEAIDERTLAPSTLHRWISRLASLEETCRKALGLIREKSPTSEVFRKVVPTPPWKYRTDGRRRVLQDARRLLVAEAEYRALFGLSAFPRLATACAWR